MKFHIAKKVVQQAELKNLRVALPDLPNQIFYFHTPSGREVRKTMDEIKGELQSAKRGLG